MRAFKYGGLPGRVTLLLLLLVVVANAAISKRFHELLDIHRELRGTEDLKVGSLRASIRAGNIPHIVHQTWKTHQLPAQFQKWSASWLAVNPGWLHVIWSDEENRKLVQQHYSWFLAAYDSFAANISRADAIRPLLMHRYGGVYADLDSQAFKPLSPLLEGKRVVLAQMGSNPSFEQSIPNAFMASAPDQKFWLHFARQIAEEERLAKHPRQIEQVAGPSALKKAYKSYRSANGRSATDTEVTVLSPRLIFPVDWSAKKRGTVPAECDYGGHPRDFDAEGCVKRHYPHAYSVQWWAHSWGKKGAKRLEQTSAR